MRTNVLLTFICLALGISLKAQQPIDIFKLRINHKWYFTSFLKDGDTSTLHLPPIDAISDSLLSWNVLPGKSRPPVSPFKLFESDDKIGVIDYNYKIILTNAYKRIRPLAPDYFAVEIDSLFTVVTFEDGAWKECLKGETAYNDIIALKAGNKGINYFLVKKGEYWGVHKKNDTLVVAPEFTEVQITGHPNYYKVKRKGDKAQNWWLIDGQGKFSIPFGCQDIIVLDDNLFAYMLPGDDFWLMSDSRDKAYKDLLKVEGFMPAMSRSELLGSFILKSVKKVNRHFAVYTPMDDRLKIVGLFHIKSGRKIIDTTFAKYIPLDDDNMLGLLGKTQDWVIIDSQNIVKTPDNFQLVEPSGIPGLYRVMKNNAWGLLSLSHPDTLLLPCSFNSISLFKNNIALISFERKMGAVGYDGKRMSILPCIYEPLEFEDENNRLIEPTSGQHFFWTPKKGFSTDEQGFGQPAVVVDFKENKFIEAEVVAGPKSWNPKFKVNQPLRSVPFYLPDSTTQIKFYKGQWRFLKKSNGYMVLADSILYTGSKVVTQHIIALYTADKPVKNVAELFYKNSLSQMSFYSLLQKKTISKKPMLGFRSFSSASTYTAFVDTSMQMGLINAAGEEKRSADGQVFRCTYIGPFVKGVARICYGGKLMYRGPDNAPLNNMCIGSEGEMYSDFNLVDPDPKSVNGVDNGPSSNLRCLFIGTTDPQNPPKWGYINLEGDIVAEPKYFDYVFDFDERYNVTLVCKINKKSESDLNRIDYGLINQKGELVQPIQFTNFFQLNGRLLGSMDSTLSFSYDTKGRQIFTNQKSPKPFSQGLALFQDTTGQWGFADTTGQIAIKPVYLKANDFSEGLAAVVDSSETWIFITPQQKIAFKTTLPANVAVAKFVESRCRFKKINGKIPKWGYLNKAGRDTIPAQYEVANDFSHGAAIVATRTIVGGKIQLQYGLIDTLGAALPTVSFGQYKIIHPFTSFGLACVQDAKTKKWGIINHLGEEVVKPTFRKIIDSLEFTDGLIRIQSYGNSVGLIEVNNSKRLLLDTVYEQIRVLGEKMVAARKKGSKSSVIFNVSFTPPKMIKDDIPSPPADTSNISAFYNGVALISLKKKVSIDRMGLLFPQKNGVTLNFFSEGIFGANANTMYFSDQFGENIFIDNFLEITPFYQNVAKVRVKGSRGGWSAINNRGLLLMPPKYKENIGRKIGFIVVNPNRIYGLYDKNGAEILPPRFDQILQFNNGIFRVELGERVGYYRIKGNNSISELWPLQN